MIIQEEEIKQELADVTIEELLKARANGSHTVFQRTNVEKKSKRANKNRYGRRVALRFSFLLS